MSLAIKPLTLKQANAIVEKWHRHHKPVVGCRFCIGVYDNKDRLVGAAIVGRPISRGWDHYLDCEVIRLVTNGEKNACSCLYGACARIAKEMGFNQIITYILDTESGISLKASGWICDGVVRKNGVGWNNRKGRRTDQPVQAKIRWRKIFKNNDEDFLN